MAPLNIFSKWQCKDRMAHVVGRCHQPPDSTVEKVETLRVLVEGGHHMTSRPMKVVARQNPPRQHIILRKVNGGKVRRNDCEPSPLPGCVVRQRREGQPVKVTMFVYVCLVIYFPREIWRFRFL